VVTLGSFRGAAQRLNTTHRPFRKRIAQLEREMGVKPAEPRHRVHRDHQRRQLMVLCGKADRAALGNDGGGRPIARRFAVVMRLGVAETSVHTWLSRLIKSVNTAYPICRWRSKSYHAEPEAPGCWRRNRARVCARAIVRLQRAHAHC